LQLPESKRLLAQAAIMDKVRLLNVLLGLTLFLSCGFTIASFVATNKCYEDPCVEGDGLDVVFKVSRGLGFQVVVSGFLFIFHTAHGLRVLNKAQTGQSVQMGISVGLSIATTIVALQNAVLWGSQALMVDDLGAFQESGRNSHVPAVVRQTFTAICAFASMIFVADLAISILLFLWKDELLNESTGINDTMTGGYKDFAPEDNVGFANAAGSAASSDTAKAADSYQGSS